MKPHIGQRMPILSLHFPQNRRSVSYLAPHLAHSDISLPFFMARLCLTSSMMLLICSIPNGFSKYENAPALLLSSTLSRSVTVVSMITIASGSIPLIRFNTSVPDIAGITTSRKTRSCLLDQWSRAGPQMLLLDCGYKC